MKQTAAVQVWACAAGHTYASPKPIVAATCGICARLDGPRSKVTDGIRTWAMTLIEGEAVNA